MKKIVSIISALIIIILISAFITPIIYQFTDFKFHRIMSRCIMVGVILATIFYIRRLDKGSLKTLALGYGLKWQGKSSAVSITQGFLITFFILVALMIIEVFLGARIIKVNIKSTFVLQIIEYIGAAFIIGFIEEFFFRGLLFNKAKSVSLSFAFIVTNAFYALVHFFKPARIFIDDTPTVVDSFRLLGAFLAPFLDPISLLPGFIGLLIFGLVLTYAYWKTNSLYYSIGIHAGAVFFLKADGFLLNINHEAPILLYGDKNVYTGILGWIFMACIGLCLMLIFRRFPPKSST